MANVGIPPEIIDRKHILWADCNYQWRQLDKNPIIMGHRYQRVGSPDASDAFFKRLPYGGPESGQMGNIGGNTSLGMLETSRGNITPEELAAFEAEISAGSDGSRAAQHPTMPLGAKDMAMPLQDNFSTLTPEQIAAIQARLDEQSARLAAEAKAAEELAAAQEEKKAAATPKVETKTASKNKDK